MPAEEQKLDFEKITQIYLEEKKSPQLSKIGATFYEDIAQYLMLLQSEYEAEERKDSNSAKTLMLKDELKKITKKIEHIFELRERKILLLAALKANGITLDIKNLAKSELELIEKLTAILRSYRVNVFENISMLRSKEKEKSEPKKEEAQDKVSESEQKAHAVVYILEDIPSFAGIDQNYSLKKEDVITLPVDIAEILCSRGKARRII